MYVRVEKQNGDRPYNSIVYGYLISSTFAKYIVLNPHSNCFELVDLLDNIGNTFARQIHIIQPDKSGFMELSGSALLKLKKDTKITTKVDNKSAFDSPAASIINSLL